MKKIICSHCKSDRVNMDAYARWDPKKDDYIFHYIFHEYSYCEECDGQCSAEEVELTPNEALKLKQQGNTL